jgi:hypothetical protein
MTYAATAEPSAAPARRIALLNVKYSPNLGDGLLSECLEAELAHTFQAIAPGTQVFSIDLAGRRAYPAIAPSRRAAPCSTRRTREAKLREHSDSPRAEAPGATCTIITTCGGGRGRGVRGCVRVWCGRLMEVGELRARWGAERKRARWAPKGS